MWIYKLIWYFLDSFADGLTDPAGYSASLASASFLYSSWFSQSKTSQLFGLQGK